MLCEIVDEAVPDRFPAKPHNVWFVPVVDAFTDCCTVLCHYRSQTVARYRDIRHKVFAHKATADMTEINGMFAKTNIEEMKALFGFLHALHEALWELFNNGRKPD
jgi:hypothetical protein